MMRWRTWQRLRRPAVGLAIASTIAFALFGIRLRTVRPQPTGAQPAVASSTPTAVRSFIAAETTDSQASGLASQRVMQRWYQAPNRWRVESTYTSTGPQGAQQSQFVTVSDGTDLWSYRQPGNDVQVNEHDGSWNGFGELAPFGRQPPNDLGALLKQESVCSTPTLQGSDTVAGRPAYVIDLGRTKCPSVAAPDFNGRRLLWVDKETYFVLKSVQDSEDGSTVLSTMQVTSIQYNVPLDPARFSFTPPAGATVQDFRPKPAPNASGDEQQLEALAKQVDFPLFAPRALPADLVPRQPGAGLMAPVGGVELDYVPPAEAATTAPAGQGGIAIREQRATYTVLANWTGRAQAASIAGSQGWLRRGVHNEDGSGSDSAAIVLRDGTLISVSSFTIAPEELLAVAGSLQPVPGGHAPLPDPTPPALDALRQTVSFPIFVPAYVPAGLTPEPPVGGDQPSSGVTITYHTADGSVAMEVLDGPAGCCLEAQPRQKSAGESVALPNGLTAHLLDEPPQYGGPILWWDQDGTYIAVSGPQLTRDDLLTIAASMSKTAALGRTELPAGRPAPTPVPAPSFAILRPSWLPEPMTVREQYQDVPGFGLSVTLGFDPRPNDPPHTVLTLTEMPLPAGSGAAGSASSDPRATRETIGGHEVTVVHRGDGCVTLSWTQGAVLLRLANAYDPPGQLRYSCDQLRQIMASIR